MRKTKNYFGNDKEKQSSSRKTELIVGASTGEQKTDGAVKSLINGHSKKSTDLVSGRILFP